MIVREYNNKDSKGMENLLKEFLEYTRKAYSRKVLEFDDFIDSKKNSYAKDILKHFKKLKKSKIFVAEEGNQVIGYIVGNITKNNSIVMKKEGHIFSYFVSRKYRGKGVGKELYNKLVKWFKKQKCDHLSLDVYEGNEKSYAMYRKWGFKEVHTRMKKKLQ